MTLYFFIPCPIFDIYKSESLVFGSTFKKDDSIFTYVNSTIYLVTEEIINNGRLKYFLKKISPKYFRSTFFLSPHPQNIIQRISNITQQVMTFAHRIYTYPRVYHSSPPLSSHFIVARSLGRSFRVAIEFCGDRGRGFKHEN